MSTPNNQALPSGYQLLNYRIDKQISRGGFAVVYRAFTEEEEVVAIKEYLPAQLVLRSEGDMVSAISTENLASFRYGMKCFFEEGRTLAQIQHPNVVRVLNFFRANGTVYMVMQYERGKTLQELIRENKEWLTERSIRRIFIPLLNGLREVHTHKLLHLDIKPANIYVRADGSPVLLDFGAARQVLAPDGNKFAPMYTPGFAAPEQYKNRDKLGPWTDIYAIGASIFTCLAGFPPQPADSRLEQDHLVSARKIWGNVYSDNLLEIIDWCLQMTPESRPQSVFALQKAIRGLPKTAIPAPTENEESFFTRLKTSIFGSSKSRP